MRLLILILGGVAALKVPTQGVVYGELAADGGISALSKPMAVVPAPVASYLDAGLSSTLAVVRDSGKTAVIQAVAESALPAAKDAGGITVYDADAGKLITSDGSAWK